MSRSSAQSFGEDDYLLFDCPGQIELFTHVPVLKTLVDYLRNDGWNVCAVFCLDSHFITDSAKFIAGCFQALAAMVTLEVAHVNVLTKVDLLDNKVRDITHVQCAAAQCGRSCPRVVLLPTPGPHAIALTLRRRLSWTTPYSPIARRSSPT